jgi:N-methylhydantoinase A
MLGCPRVVFPHGAGVESAIGLLIAEPSFDLARTRITSVDESSLETINAIFEELHGQGARQLTACGIGSDARYRRNAQMRFVGQGHEIDVDFPNGPYQRTDVERLRSAFLEAYAATYGDRAVTRADPIEVVHFRVTATAPRPPAPAHPQPAHTGGAAAAQKGERAVYFPETSGFVATAIYDRYRLAPGARFEGPAVVEERESTVVILPGSSAQIDSEGNIVVDSRQT